MTTTAGADGKTGAASADGGLLEAVIRLLRRRWGIVAAVLIGAVVAGALAVNRWTPPYEGRAVLQVQTASAGSLQNVEFDLFYTDRLLNTFTELAESDQLHDELVSALGLDRDVPLKLQAEVPANTELLVVEAQAADPELSATAANALADRLVEDIRQTLTQRFDSASEALRGQLSGLDERIAELRAVEGADTQVVGDLLVERDVLARSYNEALSLGASSVGGVSVVQPAAVPTARSIPPPLLVGFAGVLGLLGGLAVALAVDRLDHRVYDVTQAVVARGQPVLGELKAGSAAIADAAAEAVRLEPLEPQAIGVAFRLRQASPRSLLLTSPFTGTITPGMFADLTRALASTGLRVVAVDAALDPALHAVMSTSDRPGLQEGLRHGKPLAELAVPTRYANVSLVPGGQPSETGSSAIEAFWVLDQLDSLTDVFDLVVINASPLLESAEASLLGTSVEGTVLVLEDGRLHEAELDRALEQATALPSGFLGVVVARTARRRLRRRPSSRRS